jgi:hypothetical protein
MTVPSSQSPSSSLPWPTASCGKSGAHAPVRRRCALSISQNVMIAKRGVNDIRDPTNDQRRLSRKSVANASAIHM